MMMDDGFKLLRGFDDGQTDGRTDNICECRVAFATEKKKKKCGKFQTIKSGHQKMSMWSTYFMQLWTIAPPFL